MRNEHVTEVPDRPNCRGINSYSRLLHRRSTHARNVDEGRELLEQVSSLTGDNPETIRVPGTINRRDSPIPELVAEEGGASQGRGALPEGRSPD